MPESYLIVGNDPYIREREEVRLRDKFLKPDEVDLNYSVYSPDEMEGIMDSVGTLPFLAEKRVVLVKDVHTISDEKANAIVSYLEKKPDDQSVLVLSADEPFKKNKHYKKLSKLAELVKAEKPDAFTIKKWIRSFFKKENVEVSPRAVDLIFELKGTDTAAVKIELEKLLSFSGGKRIEESHVEELVGRSVTETVFQLVDAINSGDARRSFRVLEDLYDQKKKHYEIIGSLRWHVGVMQKVKLLSERGVSGPAMVSELGYKPGYVRRLEAQARKYTPKKTATWLASLMEADRIIKTSKFKPNLAMEMLIVGLINS